MKYQGIRKTNALFRQEEQYCCASKLSNMRVLGLQLGTFRSLHRPEALCFGAFWRLGRAQAEGDCRLRGVNRTEGVLVWDQASWSRSTGRAGDRGGARAGKQNI